MGGALADCVFTSPPYGLGVDYGSYKDTIANLRSMLPVLADNWKRVLVMGGFAVINFGDIAGGREPAGCDEPCEYPMAVEYWPVFRRAGWRLWTRRVWCKPNPRVHAPWTIQSNRAATDFEHIWTWVLPGKPLFWKTGASARQGWFDTTKDHGVDVKRNVHAAGMAVGCAVRMVQIHCRGSKNVYEPFCGTGTTLIAAELTGRTCYGMEIEPKYCEVACQRWEKLTGEGRKQ
jgi:DNA modification methylase